MRAFLLLTVAAGLGLSAHASERRELGRHEHGVGALNIAVEGSEIAMELEVPGADIVGFEYEAATAEDKAKVDAAIATLSSPLSLFVLPASAGCEVTSADVELHGDHDEHDAEHAHEEEHAESGHDEHDHDDEHAEGAGGHTEFHAEYVLSCADPSSIDRIDFAYFEAFENARALEIQMISDKGTQGFDVERGAPSLSLAGAI